jgi:hypothetical protein
MYTNIGNYNNGLQPTLFDAINDIHHLLLSVFYYVEDQSKEFDVLSGRIMYHFKNLPVLRKKGWKQLPVDLIENMFDYIYSLDPELENNKIIKEFELDLIDVLCYSVKLPWSPIEDKNKEEIDREFIEAFKVVLNEFEKFDDIDLVHDFDSLYILREFVGIFDKYRVDIERGDKNVYKNIEKDLRNDVSFLVGKKDFPNIKFESLIKSLYIVSRHLSSFFYYNVKENVEVINECYLKTAINSPIKMYENLRRNVAIRNRFTNNSIIYFMDNDKEGRTRVKISDILNEKEIEILNNKSMKEQEFILKSLYDKKI